jgi:hypothetical protein
MFIESKREREREEKRPKRDGKRATKRKLDTERAKAKLRTEWKG